MSRGKGKEAKEMFENAIKLCKGVSEKIPERWYQLGEGKMALGKWCENHGDGTKAEELYTSAIKDFEKSYKMDKDFIGGVVKVAVGYKTRAEFRITRGRSNEARKDFEKAMGIYEDACKKVRYENVIVDWIMLKGAFDLRETEKFSKKTTIYSRMVDELNDLWREFGKQNPRTLVKIGIVKGDWGYYKGSRGHDPQALYKSAINDFTNAIKINSKFAEAYLHQGSAKMNWGVYKQSIGQDPTKLYKEAINDYTKAIEINSEFAEAYIARASAKMNWGVYKQNLGQDPTKLYKEAINDCTKAIKINNEFTEAYIARALVKTN
jgi:tetratricopeptide (TPR) repeat protein